MPYIQFDVPSETELNTLLIGGSMRSTRPGQTKDERRAQMDIILSSYLGMQAYDALWHKERRLSSAEALDLAGGRAWVLEALCGALANRPPLLHKLDGDAGFLISD